MGVDIRVRSSSSPVASEPGLSFKDDGYYWFLHPWFERLREQSGKYIDLYGDALLTRDDYPRLRAVLTEAEVMARRQPATWQVHVGTQLQPAKKELYRTIDRGELLKLIETFRTLIDAADKLDGYLECVGD